MQLYQYLLWAEFFFAPIVFIILFFISTPYGRFFREGWGWTISSKYAWLVMEFPALTVVIYYFLQANAWESRVLSIFLICWQAHYIFRTLIYPFIMAGRDKPYPLLLVIIAIVFNTINGSVNGYFIFLQGNYSSDWLTTWPFILGFFFFLIGFLINKESDFIFMRLRRHSIEYQIPKGGFFRYISNPHYFGEILQWSGWAIMTLSWSGLAFAFFSFANLAPRAVLTHRWYLEKFERYPKERKALIPFIW